MLTAGPPGCEPTGQGEVRSMLRHRRVPMRAFGDTVIAARPRDGAPVVMVSTSALVWRQLDEWITPVEIDRRLAEAFPEVADEDRVAARTEILRILRDDDLLERS